MRRSPLAALTLVAAALTGLVGWELTASPDPAAPRVNAASPGALHIAPTPAAAPPADTADWIRTVLARPLFDKDRRPPAPAGAPLAVVVPPPRLTALISGPFGRRAIFADTDSRAQTVQAGSVLGGWTVLSIGADSVSVSGPGGARTVFLARGAALPPPAAVPADEADEHATSLPLKVPTTPPVMRRPGEPPFALR